MDTYWCLWSWVFFKDLHSTDSYESFMVRSPVNFPGVSEVSPIDFCYLSVWFLKNVINCKREEGLSWNCYGRAVTVEATMLQSACRLVQQRQRRRSISVVLLGFFCRLELKTQGCTYGCSTNWTKPSSDKQIQKGLRKANTYGSCMASETKVHPWVLVSSPDAPWHSANAHPFTTVPIVGNSLYKSQWQAKCVFCYWRWYQATFVMNKRSR